MIYFTLTTLSSVGFGDYYPVNTPERIFIIIVFLIELFIFTSVIGTVMNILQEYEKEYQECDETTELLKFFSVV